MNGWGKVVIEDYGGDMAEIDHDEKGLVIIEAMHRKIHVGRLFYTSQVLTAVSTPQLWLFRIGARELHIKFSVTTSAGCFAEIIEGVTVSNIGGSLSAFNYNRDSANVLTTTTIRFDAGLAFAGGTVIRQNQAGFGSSPGQAVSGNQSTGIEYNFRPNTDYILRLTPSTSMTIAMIADMYEEVMHET